MAIEIKRKGTGLQPLPKNPGKRKDISHARVYGVLGASELPTEDFDVATPLRIKDQGYLDFCGGFASSEVTEDQEGKEMDALFQFAAIKKQKGEYKSWGTDLRTAGMALVTFGSLPQTLAPFTIDDGDRDFLANWANYPDALWKAALPQKKKTMFFVDGPHDLFDNIRMTLAQNRQSRCSVLLGVMWRDAWTDSPDGLIPEWTPLGKDEHAEGHCLKGFGQITKDGSLRLKIQNSWGKNVGDEGIFYFPRSVVNNEFAPFGQILFRDMDPEDAHYMNDHAITVKDNWIVALIKAFISTFKIHHV